MKRSQVTVIVKSLAEEFAKQVGAMPFKKNQREDLVAGFRDGARSTLLHLIELGELTVQEDEP